MPGSVGPPARAPECFRPRLESSPFGGASARPRPELGIKNQNAALTRQLQRGPKMSRRQTFDRRETTPAEREARKAFRAVEAKQSMTDYEKAQKAFHENRERLKAERLAREAEATRGPSRKVSVR